jgi:hypothetical protein
MEVEYGATTAFGKPGLEVDAAALRELYAGLRDVIRDLGLDPGLPADDLRIRVVLPERFGSPFAHALIATDAAWRIAWMASEGEEWRLPGGGGTSNLDEIVPIEECGLEIVAVDDGSIEGLFKSAKKAVTFDAAVGIIVLAQSLTGFTLQSPPQVVVSRDGEPPVEITVPAGPYESVDNAASALPQLSPSTQVITEVKLPDGRFVRITIPDAN